MAIATIKQLVAELVTLVQGVPAFAKSGYYVTDLEDLSEKGVADRFPIVGVGYNGCTPVIADLEKHPVSGGASSAQIVELQFMVLVGVKYSPQDRGETKSQATDLLDQLRLQINGYRGVNNRPWFFMGERTEASVKTGGVLFYSQIWHTRIPSLGKIPQQ